MISKEFGARLDRLIVTVRKGKCHQGKKVDGPSWDPSGDIAT